MVNGEMMMAVVNKNSVNVVHYFLAKQQAYADKLWQEYVNAD